MKYKVGDLLRFTASEGTFYIICGMIGDSRFILYNQQTGAYSTWLDKTIDITFSKI